MALKRVNNAQINEKLDAIINTLTSMDARVSALESAKTEAPKKTTKKSATKKTTKAPAKTKSTKKTSAKTSAKKSTTTKSSAKKTATKKSTTELMLEDFEPCKFKGTDNYVWNGVRGYKAMRSAYCYASQTNGKAKDLAGARKLGVTIDFDKAWNKAKAEFEKKYTYVKAADR